MVWMLERNDDVITCEIRQATNSTDYEFEVNSMRGRAQTVRFASPTDLINGYLRWQSALRGQGWRPRSAELEVA